VAVSSDPDDLLDELQRQGIARLWAEQAAKKAAGRGAPVWGEEP
jgi:hypothetical protein